MTHLPDVTALDLDLANGWLTIWFNQPDSRNALSAELVSDMVATFEAVKDARSVRGITLRGRGGVFCAGGDLKSFKKGQQGGQSYDDVVQSSIGGAYMFDLVNRMPQVVIVIIEGAAMAGGFGMACCADVVICEANARFAMTETAIGLTPALFDGRHCADLGFADFLGETVADLEAHEMQIRKQVLRCAPGAVADIKALILALPRLSREDAIQAAAENFAGRMMSDEGKEGVASFVEKRKPGWVAEP